MKQFNGFDDAKKQADASGSARLPEGAYVCKIMGVRYVNGENGYSDRIDLQFDITEGEQKDFFRKQYDSNTNEDKRWKGKTSIYVPADDGSEKDGYTKKAFASWISAFEKSNTGFTWAWDEMQLKGKTVGIVFGTTGTVIDGKEVTYTEARFAVDIDRVRSGNAPAAKFKARNEWTGTAAAADKSDGFMKIPDADTEEIPF